MIFPKNNSKRLAGLFSDEIKIELIHFSDNVCSVERVLCREDSKRSILVINPNVCLMRKVIKEMIMDA